MRKAICSLLLLPATSLFFAGCTSVTYTKQVVTTLDNKGSVVSTVITETLTEPHSETARFPSAQGAELKHISQ
jgi:hypothetical protein